MSTIINARSPFYIKAQAPSMLSSTMYLYIYEGTKETDKPASAQFTITKNTVSNNNYTVYEFSELVRDYLDVNFNQERTEDAYVLRIQADGGVFESNSLLTAFSQAYDDDYSGGAVWVEADINLQDAVDGGGSTITTEYYDYIAFDGYGYFEDGANPELSRTLLQSNTDIYYLEGEAVQVPVFSEEVTSVKFYNNGSLHTTRTISSSTDSSGQISYPSSTSTTDKIEVISASGTETINVYPTSECRYTPYKVTFVNKFGALQNIYFFKKSSESLNTQEEKFKSTIFNEFDLRYDIQKHQHKSFQKSGRESLTMNTGYVSEEYNNVIKELLMSEQVWITKGSDVLPINVKSQSLTYQTRVNDKLINYTISFDYAFDKINNIR